MKMKLRKRVQKCFEWFILFSITGNNIKCVYALIIINILTQLHGYHFTIITISLMTIINGLLAVYQVLLLKMYFRKGFY